MYFAVTKKGMAAWVNACPQAVIRFSVKNGWPFGCDFKILYFAVEKRMTVWVHAFTQTAIRFFTAKYKILKLYPKQDLLLVLGGWIIQ